MEGGSYSYHGCVYLPATLELIGDSNRLFRFMTRQGLIDFDWFVCWWERKVTVPVPSELRGICSAAPVAGGRRRTTNTVIRMCGRTIRDL